MSQETINRSFDELAKGLASGTLSRGKAIRLVGGALLGAALASLPGVALADDDCKPYGRRCRRDSQCCSRNCVRRGDDKVCGCPEGRTRCNDKCVNLKTDERHCGSCSNRCAEGEQCVDGVCQGGGCPVGDLVTPVDGGPPFCACSEACLGSCADCPGGTICVTDPFCSSNPSGFTVTCARPCP